MRLVLALALLAAPVAAQDPHPADMAGGPSDEPATLTWVPLSGEAAVGRIDAHNDNFCRECNTVDERNSITVETTYGPVTIEVTSTWNRACGFGGCPDRYNVISAPEGFLIIPGSAEIEEEATGSFLLYRNVVG